MIKSYFFLTSEAELTLRGDAERRLRSKLPSISAALYSEAIGDAIPDRPATLSGVLELWFEDRADADTAESLDVSELFTAPVTLATYLVGMERVVSRSPKFYQTTGVKGIYAFRRKQDMPVEEFQHYWWQNHGPIAALTESATSYVQCHVLKEAYINTTPAYDGVTEIYWPDVPSALGALGSRQMTEDQSNDAKKFVALDSVELMIANQHMIIPPWKETV